MLHGHPYAPTLLGLTQMRNDPEMVEALLMEDAVCEQALERLIDSLEAVCDVSYRDKGA